MFPRRSVLTLLLLGALAPATPAAAPPAGIAGRWVVQEQTYGQGSSNLVRTGRRVCLEVKSGSLPDGVTTWMEDEPAAIQAWPGWPQATGSGDDDPAAGPAARRIRILDRQVDTSRGVLSAHYVLRLSDDLSVEVSERYRLDPEADVLVGEIRVLLLPEGDATAGSYTLHRRLRRLR